MELDTSVAGCQWLQLQADDYSAWVSLQTLRKYPDSLLAGLADTAAAHGREQLRLDMSPAVAQEVVSVLRLGEGYVPPEDSRLVAALQVSSCWQQAIRRCQHTSHMGLQEEVLQQAAGALHAMHTLQQRCSGVPARCVGQCQQGDCTAAVQFMLTYPSSAVQQHQLVCLVLHCVGPSAAPTGLSGVTSSSAAASKTAAESPLPVRAQVKQQHR